MSLVKARVSIMNTPLKSFLPRCIRFQTLRAQPVSTLHNWDCRKRLCEPACLRTGCFKEPCGSLASSFHTSSVYDHKRIFEPDYLELLQPKEPVHGVIDLQMKGFDYAVLERFQGLVHSLVDSLDVDVTNCWAAPAKSWRIEKYAPSSSKPDAEYQLKTYQRVIQIADIPSRKLGIILEMLQECTPPGVTCSFVEHTEEIEKDRYVPDLEIKELKQQLDELGGPRNLTTRK